MSSGKYLERIGLDESPDIALAGLSSIHEAHMCTVPFENLDIPLRREIVTEVDRFLDKIVNARRGGFCYELNGSLYWLLGELGFESRMLSARVFGADGAPGPDFDHMTLLLNVDGERWIADVGFGDSFRHPLRLVENVVQEDADPRGTDYRLTHESDRWTMSQRLRDGEWKPQYDFTLETRDLSEYSAMCRHQQVSPESHFTRKVVCSCATPEGRVTLTAGRLIESTANGRVETEVPLEGWYEVLWERFGVELPAPIEHWPS